jgi:menaquinone-dependent protoporphyrinogen oxidase
MKTLILYATQYGFTADCVQTLSKKLAGEVTTADLQKEKAPDINGYDSVIVGGSVYMGRVQEEVKAFCAKNADALAKKNVGLFLCCGLPANFHQHVENAFPAALVQKAKAVACFGGELRMDRMKFLHKTLAKAMSKNAAELPKLNPQAIDEMADTMNAV